MDLDVTVVAAIIAAIAAILGGIVGGITHHFLALRADKKRRERDRKDEELRREQERLWKIDEDLRELLKEITDLRGQMDQVMKYLNDDQPGPDRAEKLIDQLSELDVIMKGKGEQYDLLEQMREEHAHDLENRLTEAQA